MSQSLFSQPLNVINVGIAMFSDDLKKQHVEVTQLDWTPPGQGNMQVVQALDNIADSPLADKIAAANQQALERIIQSHPVLIGFDQAINVVPGMTAKTILHAGPPITWEKIAKVLGCTCSNVSHDYKNISFYYVTYRSFRNDVNEILDKLLMDLGLKEIGEA